MANHIKHHLKARLILTAACWLVNVFVIGGTFAAEDKPTATVTDKAGKTYRIRNFTLTHSSEKVELPIWSVSFPASKLGGAPLPQEALRIFPLRSIQSIKIAKQGTNATSGKAVIKMSDQDEMTVQCGSFRIDGTHDLGELGSGGFSMGQEINEIRFSWADTKPWLCPPFAGLDGSTNQAVAFTGSVVVMNGSKVSVNRFVLYYKKTYRGECPTHRFPFSCYDWCPQRPLRERGHAAKSLKINTANTTVDLELSKIGNLNLQKYPTLGVTLKSGTTVDAELKLIDTELVPEVNDVVGLLCEDRTGWVFIPRQVITTVEFEDQARTNPHPSGSK